MLVFDRPEGVILMEDIRIWKVIDIPTFVFFAVNGGLDGAERFGHPFLG